MECNKCGTEVTKKDKFCPKCGAEVVKRRKKKKDIPEVEEYQLKDKEIEKLSGSFVSRDEKYIASLGNGYIMNYLSKGSMSKGFAFITDKRVYFKGSCLSGTGKQLVKTDEERTVDVRNITGSGFIYRRYWGILIALFISILASLAGSIYGVWRSHYEASEQKLEDWCSYINGNSVITSNSEEKIWEELLNILDELEWEESEDDYRKAYYDGESICRIYRNNNDGNYYIENYIDSIHDELFDYDHYCVLRYDDGYGYELDTIDSTIESTKKLLTNRIKSWHDYKIKETRRVIVTYLIDILPIGLGITLVIACCIGIKNYLFKRKTLFRIEYAGGCIAFDVSFYAKAEIDDFQKQLRRVKDFAEETATVRTVTVEAPVKTPTQSSVPDDLRKYADLLKDGLISQEEYDAMKKKILGL